MNRTVFFIFFLLSTYAGFSQSDFKEGCILLSENDTIFGLLNNKNYYLNSLHCDFKSKEKEEVKRFYPKDIYGYRFNDGKFYISKEIKIKTEDTLFFFEYLIKGEINVYFRQDRSNNRYYASKDGKILNELKYSKGIKKKNGKNVLYEHKQFIGLLNYLTNDYPELSKDIEKIKAPEHDKLIKFSKKYHDLVCKDNECIIYEKKMPRKTIIEFFGNYTNIYKSVNYIETKRYYTAGFNLLFQQSKQRERYFVGIGMTGYWDSEFNKLRYIVPLSFHYIHPKSGFSPYFSFSLDLIHFNTFTYRAGINYRYKRVSLSLSPGIETAFVVLPYGISYKLGIMIDLK